MREPPKSLPATFLPIWEALSQADESAVSRRELARELQVSSVTLHRVLVTGDVPDLRRASVREQRAWTRTLSRVAHRLGFPPRSWIDAVGIPWTETIASLVAEATASSESTQPRAASAWPGLSPRGQTRSLRVGVARLAAFESGTTWTTPGFLHHFGHRLVSNLFSGGNVAIRSLAPESIRERLESNQLDLAVGVWDSVDARRVGICLIPIPGLTLPIRMLTHRSDRRSGSEIWSSASTRFLCPAGSAALEYLLVQCEVDPTRVEELEGESLDPVALMDRTRQEGCVLVLDARTAWWLVRSVEEMDWREVEEVTKEGALATLCVALPPSASSIMPIVEHTLKAVWIASNPARTASLYAELLEVPASDLTQLAGPSELSETGDESHTSPPLLASLAKATALSLPDDGGSDVDADRFLDYLDDALRARVGDEAARALLPPRPKTTPLHESDPPPKPFAPPQCQSCSVSLLDYGGVSSHYCRYCSDENGVLRTVDEVQADIRRWMLRWQDGANESNIDERVRHFMRAMPAWADRV